MTRHISGLLIVLTAACAMTAEPAAAADDCFDDLMRGQGAEIACRFPVRMSETERRELAATTRGYVVDATCTVDIRVLRTSVTAAIDTPEHIFEAPPQPVACSVTTASKAGETVHPITGTFAPRVVFKGGVAVEATPGLGNIAGVPRPVSWPVEMWVNRGATVRDGMLKVVNAWVAHMRTTRRPRSAQR